MSRIDQALRRAGGHTAAASRSMLAAVPAASDTAADAALWEFADEREEGRSLLDTLPLPDVTGIDTSPADPELDADFIDSIPEPEAIAIEPPPEPPIVPVAVFAAATPPPAAVGELPAAAATVAPAPIVMEQPAVDVDIIRAASQPRPLVPETMVTATQRKDAVEQYRKLAATLYHVQANRGIRVVLCTSAMMAEGKTVTSANLALTLSQSYQRRVLLIDADLRRPRLHTLFNIPNDEGLYEALGAQTDRKVTVVPVSPWLSVVTAGRPGPDPVHVLTSERLTRVLEDAGSNFDWVIIDTPPVLVLPDAGLLMGLVDAAILVVGAGQTPYRMVKRAADALGRDRIVGVVMNRADDRVLHDGYGHYYGYSYEAAARTQ